MSLALRIVTCPQQHRRQFSEHSVADVLVCAASSDEALRERLKVASLLWTAGINAEYLHEWPVNHDSLHAMCVHRHIPVMVQVKPAALEQGGKLKVRHLASSMSAEVALGDLVKTVKSMIQAPADATPAVVTSTVGSSSAHAPELELILLDNRSTHVRCALLFASPSHARCRYRNLPKCQGKSLADLLLPRYHRRTFQYPCLL